MRCAGKLTRTVWLAGSLGNSLLKSRANMWSLQGKLRPCADASTCRNGGLKIAHRSAMTANCFAFVLIWC
jgi:hypothetical protein